MSAAVLYNNALRQTQQLQKEIASLEAGEDTSAAVQGQITAGLASLQRCANDLDDMARREVTAQKKEKAIARSRKVREDYTAIQQAFAQWKIADRARGAAAEREALLGSGQHAERRSSSAVHRHGHDPQSTDTAILMFDSMVREGDVLDASGNRVDDILHMGQTVLQDLYEQRDMLKGAQRRLYDVANHLGLSTSVIKYIERRSTEDKYIFFGGIIVTILVMWFIVHYIG
ncbi:protein transport protein bos1 [Geranomyces variabilis]|nr:protein transport protein bos1 [Geranomyces variabilis]